MTDALRPPPEDRRGALRWVATNLDGLFCDEPAGSTAFTGGQKAADAALGAFDVRGYASARNEVLPRSARGASRLSPYIRHGLIQLPALWDHVDGGPSRDVQKFRSELLWQEYARHWYARHGVGTRTGVRFRQLVPEDPPGWRGEMLCVSTNLEELHADGWLVNQARMWLASHWSVRNNVSWRDGEDHFFKHLLDGSRAANRLGWQWTSGLSKAKSYGFSQSQVLSRAPGLCERCALVDDCPIADWPTDPPREAVPEPSEQSSVPDEAGPPTAAAEGDPNVVWLTAESLGDDDPALAAHPDLRAVFVFDEALLSSLQLSSKRLVFLAETLADLATRRPVDVFRGNPRVVLGALNPAVTFAPVPGFRRLSRVISPAVLHPWPWLRRPDGGPVSSFSKWSSRYAMA